MDGLNTQVIYHGDVERKTLKVWERQNAYIAKDSAICVFHWAHLLFLLLPGQEEDTWRPKTKRRIATYEKKTGRVLSN